MNATMPLKVAFLAGTALGFIVTPPGIAAADPKPVYSVSQYDPDRNPKEDLAATVAIAKKDGRRILLLVGGNWCPWCRLIPRYFEETESVAGILASDYVIMKVFDSNQNGSAEFLGAYPDFHAYPHLIVLDSDGKHLHSQDSEELEAKSGRGYDDDAFTAFLRKWSNSRLKEKAK